MASVICPNIADWKDMRISLKKKKKICLLFLLAGSACLASCVPKRGMDEEVDSSKGSVKAVNVGPGIKGGFKVVLVTEPGSSQTYLRFLREKLASEASECRPASNFPDLCLLEETHKEPMFFRSSASKAGSAELRGEIYYKTVQVGAIGELSKLVSGISVSDENKASLVLCAGIFDSVCALKLSQTNVSISLENNPPKVIAAKPTPLKGSAIIAGNSPEKGVQRAIAELKSINLSMESGEATKAIEWSKQTLQKTFRPSYKDFEKCELISSVVEASLALQKGVTQGSVSTLDKAKINLCQSLSGSKCPEKDLAVCY